MHPFNGTNFPLEESDLAVERVDGELQVVSAAGVRRGRRRLGPGRHHCHHRYGLCPMDALVASGTGAHGWIDWMLRRGEAGNGWMD